jgi:two-component system chemotaxis sensor kinase CheA
MHDRHTAEGSRLIHEHLPDGVVAVCARGVIAGEATRSLVQWLGEPREGDTLWDYFARTDRCFASAIELPFRLFQAGLASAEDCLRALPKRLERGPLSLGLSYVPIQQEGQIAHVLVVARDLATERASDREETERREYLEAVSRLLLDPRAFSDFVEETSLAMAELRPGPAQPRARRSLHTVKGNAGMVGLESFATLCERAENCVEQTGALGDDEVAALRERWEHLRARFVPVLNASRPDIALSRAEHQELLALLRNGTPRSEVLSKLEMLGLAPVHDSLARFAEYARRLCARIGKCNVHVSVRAVDTLRHDLSAFAPFWSAFVHAIHNVVDHGIDSPEERGLFGKPAIASIELSAWTAEGTLHVELRDDGPGIDWELVRLRAQALGVGVDDDMSPAQLLFADGVSTRSVAGALSGRGIGLGALRSACAALDGHIDVSSKVGSGTTFRFSFPVTAKTPHVDTLPPRALRPQPTQLALVRSVQPRKRAHSP